MENNNRGGDDRRSEGRREYGSNSSNGGRKRIVRSSSSYGRAEKVEFAGERRSFGDGERKPFNGERRSFGGGERRPFNGERRSFGGGERRPFNGERRSFGDGERRPFNGERRSFGDGERRPFNGERRSFGGERRSFGGERRSFGGGERRSFGGPRRGGFGGSREDYKRANEGIDRMISKHPSVDNINYSDNDTVKTPIKDVVRLNKFIANSGVCSRREADNLILAGVVTVNGNIITELGVKVNILTDDIRFNGQRLKGEEKVYVVMNKPKGFVTSVSDPHAEKTVMDLLKGCETRIFPVGRLDKSTTGVLMFTNDGEMAEKLTHPSYNKKKIYQVTLDNQLTQEDFEKIIEGVTLNDGLVKADELEYIDENDHKKLGIEIHSGKNRIVRRIFESLGYEVRSLDRVYFAGLTKKNLKRGDWRFLSEGEINILKMGAYN